MRDVASDAAVLEGGRGVWSATPWNYSSLRFLSLKAGGTGELIYGYGQTIYAVIKVRWEVISHGRLRLTYEQSPPYQLFAGYSPIEGRSVRELGYVLMASEVSGIESIVAQPYRFGWTLELSESPWPPELQLPYEIPRVFYGHREEVGRQGA